MTSRERLLAALSDLAADEVSVVALVAERLAAGRRTYGELHLVQDARDFVREAAEELLDASVYLAANLERVGRAQGGSVVERAQRAAIELKACHSEAQSAEEREGVARAIASLTGDDGASLTERAMAEVLDSGRGVGR